MASGGFDSPVIDSKLRSSRGPEVGACVRTARGRDAQAVPPAERRVGPVGHQTQFGLPIPQNSTRWIVNSLPSSGGSMTPIGGSYSARGPNPPAGDAASVIGRP
jgi:hypothetical protein